MNIRMRSDTSTEPGATNVQWTHWIVSLATTLQWADYRTGEADNLEPVRLW
jgi:hypothetical protein